MHLRKICIYYFGTLYQQVNQSIDDQFKFMYLGRSAEPIYLDSISGLDDRVSS
jgi:hypothetical protein